MTQFRRSWPKSAPENPSKWRQLSSQSNYNRSSTRTLALSQRAEVAREALGLGMRVEPVEHVLHHLLSLWLVEDLMVEARV